MAENDLLESLWGNAMGYGIIMDPNIKLKLVILKPEMYPI
jgi:hypothetical protein